MQTDTGVTIWAPDGVTRSPGLLVGASDVLVRGELADTLVGEPHRGLGLVVRLDAADGDRTECAGVARVHVVHIGGPYVTLELAQASKLAVSPFPPDLLTARRDARPTVVTVGGEPGDRPWWVCLLFPWKC